MDLRWKISAHLEMQIINPIPVKYAMNVLGWEAGECRLPLVEPSDAHKEQIEQALQAAGLIKE